MDNKVLQKLSLLQHQRSKKLIQVRQFEKEALECSKEIDDILTTNNFLMSIRDMIQKFQTYNLEEIEKIAIKNALMACDGNRGMAIKLLGIGERTLYRKIIKYNIKLDEKYWKHYKNSKDYRSQRN